jgi:peroxiredoxin Q/BCP
MALEVGDKAPNFSGEAQGGKTISLDDFKGQKLALYFYPKDDTPGCTKEACNLRDNIAGLKAKNIAVVGVSPDNPAKHDKFIEKYSLPFPLIADTEKEILQAYDAWGEKSMYGKKYMGVLRKTYLIDEEGKIQAVIGKVKTSDHASQILSALDN